MIYSVKEAREKYSDDYIIERYNSVKSLRKLSEELDINRKFLSIILKENNIKTDKFQAKYIHKKYNPSKYISDDETMEYVLIDKNDKDKIFKDVNNKSGIISIYLKERYNIDTPNTYFSHKYFKETGDYWFEKYFDIELRKKKKKVNRKVLLEYWNNKENCFNEAKKYRTKNELYKTNLYCYNSLKRNKWMDEVTELFFNKERQFVGFNQNIHIIYIYLFESFKTCYIGRTLRLNERHNQHKFGCYSHGKIYYDNVYKFCQENNIEMEFPIILEDKLNAEESQIREEYWVNYYKKLGYNILNKGALGKDKGSLGGGVIKWTYESCKEAASKCKNREEFKKKYPGANRVSRMNNWIEEFFPFLSKKPNGYWNDFNNCLNEAKGCKNIKALAIKNPPCYNACKRNGFLDVLFPKKYK